MLNEVLFHLISLMAIAIITILPANYILEKQKRSLIIKNRRDVFKPWILLSSIYLGNVVTDSMTVIAGMVSALAWYIVFSIPLYLPLIIKQPEGWASKLNKWLEYPSNK